ncbi:NAD(+)--rifampin ADP-ribosyltransferase [Microbacterium sp. cx-55]|nr:NAD(+)--rifampin ADP-ribosyltransferase [Microbacterium sp. cx-55]
MLPAAPAVAASWRFEPESGASSITRTAGCSVFWAVGVTALRDGAGLSAELASDLARDARAPRVYLVEPTGAFEDDPNVTDKKFPGNPTRSYRSVAPLRVVGEVTDWTPLTPEARQQWRSRIVDRPPHERGEIIN